jgi:hypothetical protein
MNMARRTELLLAAVVLVAFFAGIGVASAVSMLVTGALASVGSEELATPSYCTR